MLVAPSDHLIADRDAFRAAVRARRRGRAQGALVTFGVVPDRPETGYGYLELAARRRSAAARCRSRASARSPTPPPPRRCSPRAPPLERRHLPLPRPRPRRGVRGATRPTSSAPAARRSPAAPSDLGFLRLGPAYGEARAISVDYAVMEPAGRAGASSPCRSTAAGPTSAAGTRCGRRAAARRRRRRRRGRGDRDRLPRQLPALGGGLGPPRRPRARPHRRGGHARRGARRRHGPRPGGQAGGRARSRRRRSPQAEDYPRFHRPWGWYETLCLDGRFQVKRIMVAPGRHPQPAEPHAPLRALDRGRRAPPR